jgi:hypothetical protein
MVYKKNCLEEGFSKWLKIIRAARGVVIATLKTNTKKNSYLKEPKPIKEAKSIRIAELNAGKIFLRSK